MKSGLVRLAAALALTVGVVVLAAAIALRLDPQYSRSVEKCEATVAGALPKGSKLDHRRFPGDTTYTLSDDPGPSAAAIEHTLRKRGELLGIDRDGPGPYDEARI